MNKKLKLSIYTLFLFIGIMIFSINVYATWSLGLTNITAFYDGTTNSTANTTIKDWAGNFNLTNNNLVTVNNGSMTWLYASSDGKYATNTKSPVQGNNWTLCYAVQSKQAVETADRVMNFGANSASNLINIYNIWTTGTNRFGVYAAGFIPASTTNTGDWFDICWTVNNGNVSYYKNGVYNTSSAMTMTVNSGEFDLFGGVGEFNGNLTKICFWNNTALNSSQVSEWYNSGLGFNPFIITYYNYSINVQVNYNGVGVNASKVQFLNNDTGVSIFNVTNSSGGLSQLIGINAIVVPNVYYIVTAWINGNNTVRPISHIVYVNTTS